MLNVKGDQDCYVEIANVESSLSSSSSLNNGLFNGGSGGDGTGDYYCDRKPLGRNQSLGGQQPQQQQPQPIQTNLLNIFNYTGILYTQNEKKYIHFKLKDFYSNNSSILLTGKIPGE